LGMSVNRKRFLYALLLLVCICAAGAVTAGALGYIQLPVTHPIDKDAGLFTQTYQGPGGFTFDYPEELQVEDGGDIILNDSRNSKNFALKICAQGSACAGRYKGLNPQALEDFETTYTSKYGESTTYGNMSYVEAPVSENIITNSKGTRILELELGSKVLDSKGNDITDKECESCGGASLHYIAFKDAGSYVDLWSIADRGDLTKKIIDTLSF